LFGVTITYGAYLAYHFPVLGALKAAVIVILTAVLFPARPKRGGRNGVADPMTRQQALLIVILVVALAFWVTDVFHHISPAWVALGAAMLCLVPRWGIVSPAAFNAKLQVGPLLFIAGILAIGAIVADTGLGAWLGRELIVHLPFSLGAPFGNYLLIVLLSATIALVTTVPGVPAVMTPLAPAIAEATGLPLSSVLHLEVVGFSTPLLPYQVPAILLGAIIADVPTKDVGKLLAATAAVTIVVLIPLNWLWLRLVGFF
jgi:hypothetical protein